MKKYLYIYKSEFMSDINYILNILFGFIGYFIMIYILMNLFKYTYSDPNELINGYDMNQMVWYVVITEILWSVLGGRKLCRKICDDVKGGNIAYNLNKPYSYIGYSLVSHLGSITIKAVIYTVLGLILGYVFLGMFPNLTILEILGVILTSVLATIISILLIITIGMCSFFIEDANPLYWLYSKLILVVGVIFPIEYFPKVIQPILNFTPAYVVSYGPAKLFVDFSTEKFITILLAQLIYLLFASLICMIIYKKGVKKLNVNGG